MSYTPYNNFKPDKLLDKYESISFKEEEISEEERNHEYNTRILHYAAHNNDINTVNKIMMQGYNPLISNIDIYNHNALNASTKTNNINIVKNILSFNTQESKEYLNNTAEEYFFSVKHNYYDIQFELLYHGINVNKKYKEGGYDINKNSKTLFMRFNRLFNNSTCYYRNYYNMFNRTYTYIDNDHIFKATQLMVLFGANIQDLEDYTKTNPIICNSKCWKWINKVKCWSKFRIASTILSPEQFRRVNNSEHIKLDFSKESKETLLNTCNSSKIKEVIESHYKGWNPNNHHYYSNKLQKNIITILIIALRIDNLFEAVSFEKLNKTKINKESSNIMNLWLPSELWIYLLQFL